MHRKLPLPNPGDVLGFNPLTVHTAHQNILVKIINKVIKYFVGKFFGDHLIAAGI